MAFKLALLLMMMTLYLAACQVVPDLPPASPPGASDAAEPTAEAHDGWATHENNGVTLSIQIPDGWQSYRTADGIVLSEYIGTAETAGHLQGILMYVFVPRMDIFELPTSDDVNLAWAVLKQVVHNPDYVGRALASEPQAFEWDHHDAAYYLLNNRDGTLTLLLAMGLPGRKLLVSHISLPESHAARLRPLLPNLLATLTVNGEQIDPSALNHLPDPLVFPADESGEGSAG